MGIPRSPRWDRLLLGGALAGMGVLSGGRLLEYDPIPWRWIAAFTVGTALLVGPIRWGIRDRVPERRRERLGYVGAGIALLCVPIVLGTGLVTGSLLLLLDAGAFGGVVGLAVASIAERTAVPERVWGSDR